MNTIAEIEIDSSIINYLTVERAHLFKIVPIRVEQNELLLACNEISVSNKEFKEELEVITGYKIKLIGYEETFINRILYKYYPKEKTKSISQTEYPVNQLSITKSDVIAQLIHDARNLRSSDIHIESYGEYCRIRFRVDGLLINRYKLTKSEYPTLINKIKISASCDIAEKRLPQDGRIRIKYDDSYIDIRVSILPTLYGEKIVMRLLSNDASHININSLGLTYEELHRYKNSIQKTNGIILISGPTGSGKTTTLYATLKLLNSPNSNILTIEDPVEYTLDGINQVQLKEDIGLTYSIALKTFLRQDPDIIMLGEIRDAQTAQMAIRAALTGHLVLSTIHTNSAWGTVSRLVDMGVPPYLIASTLNLTVAQRLIRLLCEKCKEEIETETESIPEKFRNKVINNTFKVKGCDECNFTGYKGRKAIYEVIDINEELIEHIKSNTTSIKEYMAKKKINTLSENAFELYANGQTTLEEIIPYLITDH